MMMKSCRCWMMGMMIRKVPYILFFVLVPLVPLLGQDKDFRSWYEVEVDGDITDRLGLSGELELRTKNNSRHYDRSLLTLAASYRINEFLGSAAGHRALLVNDFETGLEPRYRLHADLNGKHGVFGMDLSLRVRFQYGFEEPRYFTYWTDNTFVNRIKLKAGYHIFGTRLDLQASAESWGLILDNNGTFFKRIRYGTGISCQLSFSSELGMHYILEDEFNQVNPKQAHVLVLAYAYSF